jgi:hypothetical protein
MEGFKNTTKIKYFKEGGFVTKKAFTAYEKKEDKVEEGKDIKKDTQMIKKGVSQHESALHKGEPKTELKLKNGGRAKKELGSARKFMKPAAAPSGAKGGPNKYKVGGTVSNVYEAKKKSGDLDAIENVKDIKPGKAAAPSKASVISKNTPAKFCGGKSVKKYQVGGGVMGGIGRAAAGVRNAVMGTPEQNAIAKKKEADYLRAKMAQQAAGASMGPGEKMAMGLAGMGQKLQPAAPAAPAPDINAGAGAPGGMGQDAAIPAQKKGGKVKKMNTGGTCS